MVLLRGNESYPFYFGVSADLLDKAGVLCQNKCNNSKTFGKSAPPPGGGGWVGATLTDHKLPHTTNNQSIDYYLTDITSAQDYYPGGMLMPGRSYSSDSYRFGMNGQEKDDEIAGNGNVYSAKFWEYDSRSLRRWNLDPIIKYWESPYASFAGNPIWLSDHNGLDSIKAPNGRIEVIGDGYKYSEDKTLLYGQGLTPKIWDPKVDPGDGNLGAYIDCPSCLPPVEMFSLPNKDPYTGIGGYLQYFWNGGIENGQKYAMDGKWLGNAPHTGFPPLPQIGKIGMYSDMQKLTKGFKRLIEAHHLIEARHLYKLIKSNKGPAVILTRADHSKLTKELQQRLPVNGTYTKEKLLEVYRDVYKDKPEWIEIVELFISLM